VLWQTLDLTELLSIDERAEQASYEETVGKVLILSDTEAVGTVWGLTPQRTFRTFIQQ